MCKWISRKFLNAVSLFFFDRVFYRSCWPHETFSDVVLVPMFLTPILNPCNRAQFHVRYSVLVVDYLYNIQPSAIRVSIFFVRIMHIA